MSWLLIIIYVIPIVGTIVSMGRRARALWGFGGEVRKRIPTNPVSRTLKQWSTRIRQEWKQLNLGPSLRVRDVNVKLGRLEYHFGHIRDYSIGVIMTAGAVFNLTMCLLVRPENLAPYFYKAFYFGVFALLSLFTYRRHVTMGLKMTEFMRVNPWVHPHEFFEHYYRGLGPLNEEVPVYAKENVTPEDVSYATGKPPQLGKSRLMFGFYDTAIFARSAYKALQMLGPVYGSEVFDVMASLWGSRIIQLFRSNLRVHGIEKFQQIEGKVILVFNHKSHLDFVLNFFAFSRARLKNGKPLRPRYMAAKDHFVDNKLVYEGLGVGRLIESVDMIFVDRQGKGIDAIQQAANVLVNKDVAIAMFPQGTRAYGNLGPGRTRRDAGFYTAGSATRLREPLGHLKKGCAFLALDTAIALHKQGRNDPVNLVFIGIDGTADLVPKGSFEVQTESTVTFTVGDVVTIYPADVAAFEKPRDEGKQLSEGQQLYLQRVQDVMSLVNTYLVRALHLHTKLSARFIGDVKDQNLLPAPGQAQLQQNLRQWSEVELLPYQIIDRIYALDPSYWQPYLQRAAALFAQTYLARPELEELNAEIIDYLHKTRGKLMERVSSNGKKQEMKKRAA